jgi:hypothetical protein
MYAREMKKRGKLEAAATVLVPVSPALERAWEKLAHEIDSSAEKGASAFDELWEAVAHVIDHEPPLYVFGGYKTAADFFEHRLHVDTRTAQRNIRVARYATPQEEAEYGATNLDALIGYLEAKHGKLNSALPISIARMRIPITNGKKQELVRFPKLTAPQINAATRALLAKKSPTPKNPARHALEGALGKHDALSHVVVHEREGFASFTNVPLASIGVFARAITAAKLPPIEVKAKKKSPKAKSKHAPSRR